MRKKLVFAGVICFSWIGIGGLFCYLGFAGWLWLIPIFWMVARLVYRRQQSIKPIRPALFKELLPAGKEKNLYLASIINFVRILLPNTRTSASYKNNEKRAEPEQGVRFHDATGGLQAVLPPRIGADYEWERGSIVNVGFIKACRVDSVLDNPLHYYLYTPSGRRITFFPHKGIRCGWVDEP